MNMKTLNQLKNAILEYDDIATAEQAEKAIAANVDPLEILDVITEALSEVGDGFGCGELFLPDLIGAATAAQAAIPIVEAEITRTGKEARKVGTVVIGTVKGDIHDIGKSMVGALLIAHGFKVIDLGTDVPREKFVKAIQENKADILALSSLLTTTAAEQARVIEAVQSAGVRSHIKIMVGGGAISAEFARSIGADGYGETAAEGVTIAKQLSTPRI
jgi:corrinoid protein of di/trimethylamine methyltransferase